MFSLLCAIYDFVQPKRFDIFVVVLVFDYFPWFVFIYAFVQPKRFDVFVGDCWVWLCCIVSNTCIFLCVSFLSGVYLYIYSSTIFMFGFFLKTKTFCSRSKVQPLWDFCFAFWFCWSTSLFFCLIFGRMVVIISWTSYFLMFIFRHWLCCFSFMPLFEKRTTLSASLSSHGFVQPKRFDVSVGDCCVRLCCIVSNICIFLCAFLVWRLFVYAFWFCWSKF